MTTKIEENKNRMAEQIKARQEKKKDIPFSVTQYQDMKSDGMSDAKIIEKHGLNPVQLNKWKNEHNLIGKHNVKTIQKERSEEKGEKVMNDKGNEQNVTEKPVEVSEDKRLIEHLRKTNERQFADNQKLAEENERLHKKLQEPADTSLEEELQKWKSDHSEMSTHYQSALQGAVELEEKLFHSEKRNNGLENQLEARNSEYTLLENQLKNATDRIQQLKQIESNYQSLEVLHENLKSEFNTFRARYHSIENDLEEFKDTEKMLVSTMERYVKLYTRVDEVTG